MPYTEKVISLSSSRLSHAFDIGESFWGEEIERVQALIKGHVDAITDKKSQDLKGDDGHFTNLLSIALFGTYGSGKSSLLRTLVKTINDEKNSNNQFSLHVIEPASLDKGNGSFLYAFLAEALERERLKFGNEDDAIFSPLLRSVQELSEYLQAVDVDSKHNDDDPIGTSLAHLERHSSALRLSEKMNKFLDALVMRFTGSPRGVIILPVDDADMGTKTLVSTLQLYRRYLQHPRLIPIFTFTGRVAEELLCSHFEKELKLKSGGKGRETQMEMATNVTIGENLAQQYLGKIFPVRNRIKLGMAAARAQQAKYVESTHNSTSEEEKAPDKAQSIFDLLCYSSTVLFGHTQNQLKPEIRAPLRSSTLRRQIQIIDALHASKMTDLIDAQMGKKTGDKNEPLERSFAQIYEFATWSLLNVHRDVLKELKLHLDDLYSWTSQGLQQAIVISILGLDLNSRRDILNHWRSNSEERRSLTLSLLAANVFRPRMYPEEPTGDNPSHILRIINEEVPKLDKDADLDHKLSFSCRKGLLWFLNLWHGFYLPQILARHRTLKNDNSFPERVSGIGWNLRGAAVNAIREALNNNQVTSTGMLFLNAKEFSVKAKKLLTPDDGGKKTEDLPNDGDRKTAPWQSLLLDIWCYYGTDKGKPWAAISFWRGLTLVGQLIQAAIDLLIENPDTTSKTDETPKKVLTPNEKLYIARIKNILFEHLRSAHVIGRPPLKESDITENITEDSLNEWGQWKHADKKSMVDHLAVDILKWIKAFPKDKWRIHPLAGIKEREDRKTDDARPVWKACFTRRMHGENLIGNFWHNLRDLGTGELPIKGKPTAWTGRHALSKWLEVLFKYWDCGGGVGQATGANPLQLNRTQSILARCPFITPFAPHPYYEMVHYVALLKKMPIPTDSEAPEDASPLAKLVNKMQGQWHKDEFFKDGKANLTELLRLGKKETDELDEPEKTSELREAHTRLQDISDNFATYGDWGQQLEIPRADGPCLHQSDQQQ